MSSSHEENVEKIATELVESIKKYYPEIIKEKFDSHGLPDRNGTSALQRAKACIHIELIKAGVFSNEE